MRVTKRCGVGLDEESVGRRRRRRGAAWRAFVAQVKNDMSALRSVMISKKPAVVASGCCWSASANAAATIKNGSRGVVVVVVELEYSKRMD